MKERIGSRFSNAFGPRIAMVDTATLNRRATETVSVGLGSPPAFPVRNQKSIGFSMLSPKPHAELLGSHKKNALRGVFFHFYLRMSEKKRTFAG